MVTAEPLTTTRRRWVARAGVGIELGASAFGLVLVFVNGTADLETWFVLTFAAAQATGVVVALRRPENVLGWSFLTLGTLGWLISGLYSYSYAAVTAGDVSTLAVMGAWFSQTIWMVILLLATIYPLMLFPDGLQSPRWRPIFWLANAAVIVLTAMAALTPRLTNSDLGLDVDNPVSPSWLSWFPQDAENNPVANAAFLVFAGCVLVSAVGVVLRYRRAAGIELLQLRWFAFASAAVLVTLIAEELLPEDLANSTLANAMTPLAMALLPIAVGIAITRHGLYEIDRIISRTLSYGLVTGAVIAIYALLVTAITRLLPSSSSALAVTIATLAAAALFQPLLRRVRGVVDHRFNRSHYDALSTIDRFADGLRTTIDTGAVHTHLGSAILGALQPASYGVWTKP